MDHFAKMARLCLEAAELMKKDFNMNITLDVPESSSRKRTVLSSSDTASSYGRERKKQANMNRPPSDGNAKETSRAREPPKTVVVAGPSPPPDMPEALKSKVQELGGTQVRLLLQKDLTKSDVESQQARLSIPVKKLGSDDFLDEQEKAKATPGEGIEVTLIYQTKADLEVKKSQISLRRWVYNSSSSYVLVRDWRNVVATYGLKHGRVVQVWFFRDNKGQPCFALVKLPKERL